MTAPVRGEKVLCVMVGELNLVCPGTVLSSSTTDIVVRLDRGERFPGTTYRFALADEGLSWCRASDPETVRAFEVAQGLR